MLERTRKRHRAETKFFDFCSFDTSERRVVALDVLERLSRGVVLGAGEPGAVALLLLPHPATWRPRLPGETHAAPGLREQPRPLRG